MLLLISQWNLAIFTSINFKNDAVSLSCECLNSIHVRQLPGPLHVPCTKRKDFSIIFICFWAQKFEYCIFLILHQLSDTDCAKKHMQFINNNAF